MAGDLSVRTSRSTAPARDCFAYVALGTAKGLPICRSVSAALCSYMNDIRSKLVVALAPSVLEKISGKNVRLWVITLAMPDNCIYAGEKYKLRVQFPNDYPTSPPSVFFLPPTPRHEHVYTNGDICLSLLGKDWRPIMTAQSIAQAIFSILCGAQRKSLPMDNARHAGNKPGQAQNDWVYHDDNC